MQEQNPATMMQQLELERKFQSGARWFYWIAALSLINSVINMSGGQINFVIGLATTQFVDGVAVVMAKHHADWAMMLKIFAIAANVIITGVFFMFGTFARKRQNWAFILGMVCYGADGLLSLPLGDMLGAGFHAFALWCIWGGMQAGKTLEALKAAEAKTAPNAPAT
jgi:hypothetical protein